VAFSGVTVIISLGVFAAAGTPCIKEIGLGLSVAIALDATLIGLILVPATMEIMGRWNWWLPKPLARLLPRADFEGGATDQVPARA
jgi:uncharacterized membrane protein YdfJ with MMPL/SSD domain